MKRFFLKVDACLKEKSKFWLHSTANTLIENLFGIEHPTILEIFNHCYDFEVVLVNRCRHKGVKKIHVWFIICV